MEINCGEQSRRTEGGGGSWRGGGVSMRKPLGGMRVKPYESHLKIDTATHLLAHLGVKETDARVRRG